MHIASELATVKLASGNKEVTVKLRPSQPSSRLLPSLPGSGASSNKLVKYAIYLKVPPALYVNLGVQVFGLLITLLGRLIGNRKMMRTGADLATNGLAQPTIDKIFHFLELDER